MEGKYQNKISELPNLEEYRYENIFKVYQTGSKNFYFYNILKKIEVPENINNSFFDYVSLDSRIPLTTLSYQLYSTTYLWWLILIVNRIDNPVKKLPVGKKFRYIKPQYIPTVVSLIKKQLQ